jgi:hypothetical protein
MPSVFSSGVYLGDLLRCKRLDLEWGIVAAFGIDRF